MCGFTHVPFLEDMRETADMLNIMKPVCKLRL